MADQTIVGPRTTTLVSDSYGQTLLVGPPTPTEDPSKWEVKKLREADIFERYPGWNRETLAVAKCCGFPDGKASYTTRPPIRVTLWWFMKDILQWEERIAQLGLQLPTKK